MVRCAPRRRNDDIGRNGEEEHAPPLSPPPPAAYLLEQWSDAPPAAAMKTLGGMERKNMRLARGMETSCSDILASRAVKPEGAS